MSGAPKLKLTAAEYLAIENKAEFKSEFYNGEMFAMAGASRDHNSINENLSSEIGAKLKGTGCRSYSRDQRVLVDSTGLYCYPDFIIVCGTREYSDTDQNTLTNPQVIIEILSPSSELYDRSIKFRHYQQLPSLREYILISQTEPLCERFHRQDDGSWGLVTFAGLEGTLDFKSLPVRLPMQDIYADVIFDQEPGLQR
jgi:Uma2 family endonuclease